MEASGRPYEHTLNKNIEYFFKENNHMKPLDLMTKWNSMRVIKQAPNTHKTHGMGIYWVYKQNQKKLDRTT